MTNRKAMTETMAAVAAQNLALKELLQLLERRCGFDRLEYLVTLQAFAAADGASEPQRDAIQNLIGYLREDDDPDLGPELFEPPVAEVISFEKARQAIRGR